MFSNKKFDILEKYLNITEKVSYLFFKYKDIPNKFMSFIRTKKSGIMLSLSFMSFLLITLIFICSCHIGSFVDSKDKEEIIHQQGPLPPPPSMVIKTQRPKKELHDFYVQEDVISIDNAKEGVSKTGSIWADTQNPRQLYGDSYPSKIGSIVTISIPENLRYHVPNSKDKNEAGKPEDFKFTITKFDHSGNAYLKGGKEFRTSLGIESEVYVTAIIPREKLENFKGDAKDMSEVKVNVTKNNQVKTYISDSWDENVSRKLAGFKPDLRESLKQYENIRRDLDVDKKALKVQKDNLKEREERIIKDRNRLSQEQNKLKEQEKDFSKKVMEEARKLYEKEKLNQKK